MPQRPDAMNGGRERGVQGPADDTLTLLSDAQWAYLQKRYDLTVREREVAELVCRGLRNGKIATYLKVRPETVKTHVRNIYRKTAVKSKILLLLRFVAEAKHALD